MAEPFRPGRRAVLAALLAAGSAVVTGCSRIPTDGPVVARTGGGQDTLPPRARDPGPRRGSSPDDIVRGFLAASVVGVSNTDTSGRRADYTGARAYLLDSAVEWNPDTGLTLYASRSAPIVVDPDGAAEQPPTGQAKASPSSSPSPSSSASASASASAGGSSSGAASSSSASPPRPRDGETVQVRVDLDVVAYVDADGRLTLLDAPRQRTRTFGLAARDGEWRISTVEDGIVMSVPEFGVSAFRQTAVWFPETTGRWLVPDVRYVRQAPAVAAQTAVVSAVLDGPAPWLRPAVVPPSDQVKLTVSSVPVTSGVATVDLEDSVLQLDARTQQVLQWQLRQTLDGLVLPVVTDVRLTVDSQPLFRSDGPPPTPSSGLPDPASQAGPGDVMVAVDAKARLMTVPQSGSPKLVADLALAGGFRPAMSYTDAARTYAVVVEGKPAANARPSVTLKVAEPRGPVLDVATAADLVTPSFDAHGWVWTGPRTPSGRLVAARIVGGRIDRAEVSVPWLAGLQVVALRLSREAARAVVVVDTVRGDGRRSSQLLLCAVGRQASGRPLELGVPTRLLPDLVRATDVAWADERTVVVLGSRTSPDKTVSVQPWLVDVGGDPSVRGVQSTASLGQIVKAVDGSVVTTPAQWERLPLAAAPTLAVGEGTDAVFVSTAKGDLLRFRSTGAWELVRGGVYRPAYPG